MRLSLSLILVTASLFVDIGAAEAQRPTRPPISLPKLSALAVATPGRYSGHCPVAITFEGVVTAEGPDLGPLPIAYTWLRSDNAQGPVSHAMVRPHQEVKVTETWTLGGATLPNYKGGEQLKVWYERLGEASAVVSDRAGFHIKCE